jgi:hypothetical protein
VNFFYFFVVSLRHDLSGNLGDRFQAGPSDPTQALKPKKLAHYCNQVKSPLSADFCLLVRFSVQNLLDRQNMAIVNGIMLFHEDPP